MKIPAFRDTIKIYYLNIVYIPEEYAMVYLSKSKYCGLWQCPKIAWLRKYKPETSRLDGSVLARMEAGNEVGALARSLYGDFVDITTYTGENPDLKK